MQGETWHNGVLGAAAGGAAAGAILASTGDVVTASYAAAGVESVVNEVASYIPGACTFNGQEQKELTVKNVVYSAFVKCPAETLIEGTVGAISGGIAERLVPINSGWCKPRKLLTSFFGRYARRFVQQNAVQTAFITGGNVMNTPFNLLGDYLYDAYLEMELR